MGGGGGCSGGGCRRGVRLVEEVTSTCANDLGDSDPVTAAG